MMLKHLSVSSVQQYRRCPAAWAARYRDKLQTPPTPAMAFGRAFATALEALHLGQDADAAWVLTHAAALPGGIRPGAEYGLRLLQLYRDQGVYSGVPERRFELHLPDRRAVPIPILGYVDLWTPNGLVEVKTSAAKWDFTRARSELQAAAYWYAWRQTEGRAPEHVTYLIFDTRTPGLTTIQVWPDANDLRLFEMACAGAYRGIRAGQFDPCGRQSCDTCRVPGAADDRTPTLLFGGG